MKFIVEKIASGFLFGIGLSVVLGATYYYLTNAISSSAMAEYNFEPKAIEIVKHKKIEREGKLVILGEVKNTTAADAKGVNVNVELFLNGEFIKHCDQSINGGVASGEARNFELSCGGGCKNNPILEHDSYDVYITGY